MKICFALYDFQWRMMFTLITFPFFTLYVISTNFGKKKNLDKEDGPTLRIQEYIPLYNIPSSQGYEIKIWREI